MTSNPIATTAPRLPPPSSSVYGRRRSSPHHSPTRGRHGHHRTRSDEDFLRDLSPTSTLRLFTERDTGTETSKLVQRIADASASEKALGARVARAAQRLQAWCREIGTWGWKGRFEEPVPEERERMRKVLDARLKAESSGILNAIADEEDREGREHAENQEGDSNGRQLEFWGSLPTVIVKAYDGRLQEIRDEFADLDMDELKEHIRHIHDGRASRPGSSYSTFSNVERQLQFAPLDDFEILVTQTLIRALPNLTMLTHLLDTWSVRLLVLREVPGWLAEMGHAKRAMELGWGALRKERDDASRREDINGDYSEETATEANEFMNAVTTIRGVLGGKVQGLGRRLDCMLDMLEGRDDVLPEDWIDDFEKLEATYSTWVVDAQTRLLEARMRVERAKRRRPVETDAPSNSEDRLLDDGAPLATETRTEEPLIPTSASNPQPENGTLAQESPEQIPAQLATSNPHAHSPQLSSTTHAIDEDRRSQTEVRAKEKPSLTRTRLPGSETSPTKSQGNRDQRSSQLDMLETQSQATGGVGRGLKITTKLKDELMATDDEQRGPKIQTAPASWSVAQARPPRSPVTGPISDNVEENALVSDDPDEDAPMEDGGTLVRSASVASVASVASIESISRSRVKSINIRRSGSASPAASSPDRNRRRDQTGSPSGPQSPTNLARRLSSPLTKFSSANEDISKDSFFSNLDGAPIELPETPKTPTNRGARQGSVSSVSTDHSETSNQLDESPSVRASRPPTKMPRPPLNAVMQKKRQQDTAADPPWPPRHVSAFASADETLTTPTIDISKASSANRTDDHGGDDLTRKISDILTTIPTRIRLTTGAAEGLDRPPRSNRRVSDNRQVHSSFSASRSTAPSPATLVLSPVKPDSSTRPHRSGGGSNTGPSTRPSAKPTASASSFRRTGTGAAGAAAVDSDIKLYHLTQPGSSSKPIKLFVRRVGEHGERVMVRVGGGWADLGEYLRQYAEHHGRRTVSDGRIEALDPTSAPRSGASDSPDPTAAVARAATPQSRRSSFAGAHRPSSVLGSAAAARPGSALDARATPPVRTPTAAAFTPGVLGGGATPDSGASSSGRASWVGDEVGLAGPTARKLELSEEKREWIEGMMDQAKKLSVGPSPPPAAGDAQQLASGGRQRAVSGEKGERGVGGVGEPEFGELGRVGGTKRVFLRGHSGFGGGSAGRKDAGSGTG